MRSLLLALLSVALTLVLVACASSTATPKVEPATSTFTLMPSDTPLPNLTATTQARKTLVAVHLATAMLQVTSVAQKQATALALTPSRTPLPTPTGTPTIPPEEYLTWAVFQDDTLGVAFEYPHYFELRPYIDYGCMPTVRTNRDGLLLDVGERIWITISPFDQSKISLSDHVDKILGDYKNDDLIWLDKVSWVRVGGVRAATIEYYFGLVRRYGVETHFAHNNQLYKAVFSVGVTCDYPTVGDNPGAILEFSAYWHLLDTWKFLK